MIATEYELWYKGNAMHELQESAKLGTTRAAALGAIRYNNKQLAEGLLTLMDFAHESHKHARLIGGERVTEIDSQLTRDIEHVHRKYEEEITSKWTPPTPNAEEIAQEFADRAYFEEEDKIIEQLLDETIGILTITKGKRC